MSFSEIAKITKLGLICFHKMEFHYKQSDEKTGRNYKYECCTDQWSGATAMNLTFR